MARAPMTSGYLRWEVSLFSSQKNSRYTLFQGKRYPGVPPPPPLMRKDPPMMSLRSTPTFFADRKLLKIRTIGPNHKNRGRDWMWTPSTRGIPCAIDISGTHHNVSVGWPGNCRPYEVRSSIPVDLPLTVYGRIHSDGTVSFVDVSFGDGTPGTYWARLSKFSYLQTAYPALTYIDIPPMFRVPYTTGNKMHIVAKQRYGPPPPLGVVLVALADGQGYSTSRSTSS